MPDILAISNLSPSLIAGMHEKNIDIPASLALLNRINAESTSSLQDIEIRGVPEVDEKTTITMGSSMEFKCDADLARHRLEAMKISVPESARIDGKTASYPSAALEEIGIQLFPYTAWGVLNGGLATSYADLKKNLSLGQELFNSISDDFSRLEPLCRNKPKGITPAYINPDGSAGESFLLLKMRASLLCAQKYIRAYGNPERPILPFFEMTSDGTSEALAEEYKAYAKHPWIASLIRETGTNPCNPRSACQPLLSALTHSEEGNPRRFFSRAFGKENSPLALPGGHGQSFRVLADIYRGLLSEGYRFAYIGNVDNMGYYPSAKELAIMALSGAQGGFDFSFRTAIDVKGGIFVEDKNGKKTVADIGQGIAFSDIEALEKAGKKILFNCATGLFDLQALIPKLDWIAQSLPVRLSDQDKDSGRYSQAEQSTWEVIGLLDDIVGFAVKKTERFLAAKLLAETVLASSRNPVPASMQRLARDLAQGLQAVLVGPCGLTVKEGRWDA